MVLKVKKVYASLSDAVLYALNSAEKTDMVCITGSLFTVGEGRTYLLQNKSRLSPKITK